jgi:hypothetical protein
MLSLNHTSAPIAMHTTWLKMPLKKGNSMTFIDLFQQRLLSREHISTSSNKSYRPSESSIVLGGKVHGTCALATWNRINDRPRLSADYNTQYAGFLGTSVHNMIQDTLKVDPTIEIEKPFKIDIGLSYPISGRLDLILPGNVGVELKSAYGKAFNMKDGIKVRPKIDHMLQALTYRKFCDMDKIITAYFDRGSSYRVEYLIESDPIDYKLGKDIFPLSWAGIEDRWKYVDFHLKTGNPPKAEYSPDLPKDDPNNWRCRYCGYRNECYPGHYPVEGSQYEQVNPFAGVVGEVQTEPPTDI